MGFLKLPLAFNMAMTSIVLYFLLRLLLSCWILPMRAYSKLKRYGFGGPIPSFPLGNIEEMKMFMSRISQDPSPGSLELVSHDIHAIVFPYFAQWQKSHGKVFMYWLGTEPFLYIADPEFLKTMSARVMGKNWGKPQVFKRDREPMFGNGLVMVEGDDWVRHRHVITPAFSPANLKAMTSLMVESTTKMLDKWTVLISSGSQEIDVEQEIIATAGEIIAKTSFGLGYENGKKALDKLRAMQVTLFKSNRYVGVPFGQFLCLKQTLKAKRLGKEIDSLFSSIIAARKKSTDGRPQTDLLGLLIEGSGAPDGQPGNILLTTREVIDECKTLFFGGHETTGLALAWTLLHLAMHPEWQSELREEIRQVIGEKELDFTVLAGLKKMEWVMNEVLRLYPSAPNVQRQAREDIRVNSLTIPKGTNIWIDLVAMHHDPDLWGNDVHEFKPERFKDDPHGGCKHKMGFLPFGFGGRMCVGRNLTAMEYKVVLTLVLTKFSFALSPSHVHSPTILLSLRPGHGLPLIVQPL